MKKEKMILVSDEFVEIYRNFNVINQVEEMKKLSKRELYLLLTLALDKFSEDDPIVRLNSSSFREELLEIFDVQDDKDNNNFLSQIANETGDKYIETENFVDKYGNKLPDPLTKEEVRDKRIDIIGN